MGKKDPIESPGPVCIPAGETAWYEYAVRRVMPDGRVVDSFPMRAATASAAKSMSALAKPPGTVVSIRRRLVTTSASEWADLDPDGDGFVDSPFGQVEWRGAGDGLVDEPSSQEAFLDRVVSWTCGKCGTYGTGQPAWVRHIFKDSPACDPSVANEPAPSAEDPVVDVSPVARWWTVVDADGVELRKERRAYVPGDMWWCGAEAPKIAALAFAETRSGPIFVTVPVVAGVRRGDRIRLDGPPSSGHVPADASATVIRKLPGVCEIPDCGCSGEEHP